MSELAADLSPEPVRLDRFAARILATLSSATLLLVVLDGQRRP